MDEWLQVWACAMNCDRYGLEAGLVENTEGPTAWSALLGRLESNQQPPG